MYGNNSILDLYPTEREPEPLEFFPSIIEKAYASATRNDKDLFSLRVVWIRSHNIFQPTHYRPIRHGTAYGFIFKKILPIRSMFLQYGGIPIYMFGHKELISPNNVRLMMQVSIFVNVDKSLLSTWKPAVD